MNDKYIIEQRLLAPFSPSELDFRPGPMNKAKSSTLPLIYVDSRAVNRRLTATYGLGNWSLTTENIFGASDKDKYSDGLSVVVQVTLKIHHPDLPQFVVSNVGDSCYKDGVTNKFTSAWAQAFKRSASMLGIGSFLYELGEVPWVHVDEWGKINLSLKERADYLNENDMVSKALKTTGFNFKCEVTGEIVPWEICAYSMQLYGKILCETEIKKLKEGV